MGGYTLGTRGFSCAVCGFGSQVLKSDPREKPLDKSAIPLIAPSQMLTPKHPESGCFADDSLEISNVSNALSGLQSRKARDQDAGGLKQPKHTSRSFCFCFMV